MTECVGLKGRVSDSKPSWRLVNFDLPEDPHLNVAFDEALLVSAERGLPAQTLRLWRNRNSVVLGRLDDVNSEVKLDRCRRCRTSVVRRFTGGGAVYHDMGNLNWTLVVQRDCKPLKGLLDLGAMYRILSRPVIQVLRELGVDVTLHRHNSLMIGAKKICGMSAYVKRRSALFHGTLLIDTDLKVLSNVLRSPRFEVTTLRKELGVSPSVSIIREALVGSFESEWEVNMEPQAPSVEEAKLAHILRDQKYFTDEWICLGRVVRRVPPEAS